MSAIAQRMRLMAQELIKAAEAIECLEASEESLRRRLMLEESLEPETKWTFFERMPTG